VVAHLGASGQLGLLDATTVKALVITDAEGWLLCCGQTRPGSIHDLTQVRQAGLLALVLGVTLLTDAGYQGLSAQTASAVLTPRPARRNNQIPVFPPSPPPTRPNAGPTPHGGSGSSMASTN
jgi:DDE superfamily endonuclease